MYKFLRLAFWTIVLLLFLKVGSASAATFYLEPASGNLIKGCNSTIRVKMSTAGLSSNGAQAYVGYTSLGGGTISITGGGIFSTYGTPPGVPAGHVGLFGYGGIVNGSGLNYANINVRSNVNGPFTLTFLYEAGDITSKIAQEPSSENILTGVANGTYTVIDGYCETVPPYLTNLDPVPDKPNHPVGQNIKFDIKDDSSGLNMATFVVTVKQNGIDVPFNITKTPHGTDDKWYSIDIDPISDLTPELKVVVTVSASDKAGNSMTRTYQFNDLTCAQLGCAAAITAQCKDSIDNDGDGQIDFPADSGCLDADDNNEFLSGDCPSSATSATCGLPVLTQCSDGEDNDNDGFIDLADLGCADSNDNNEFVFGEIQCPVCATTTPVAGGGGINSSNLRFFLANRSVETEANDSGAVDTLSGVTFTVAADVSGVADSISNVSLLLGDKSYAMYYDNALHLYAADVLDLVTPDTINAAVVVDHGDSTEVVVPFTVNVLPKGETKDKSDNQAVPRASVTLEQRSAQGNYAVISKVVSDSQGKYGFVVPNGVYRLTVEADDYRSEQTSGFEVNNHIINRLFGLVRTIDLLDENVPLLEKAGYLADVAENQATKIIASTNDPAVEKAAENVMAPIALGAAIAATLPALSLLSFLSYLRFLFLQPIFLLGWRKRKKWGVVYDSLTRMPVDLAVVRLVDVKTNNVVQSRVTDSEGRYAFFADPGLYRLEITKTGYSFPSKILLGFKEDGKYLDIYHGEPIHVDDKYSAVTANIPLDPIEAPEKTPKRLVWSRRLRDLQRFIAGLSIAAGILAVIITPNWFTIGLLALQVVLYFLFKKLATPGKPKNWGIVYDLQNKKPINRAVARLFSKQFNKLVSTEITDNNGRYSFMVGPNEYYVTFEKLGYQKTTSPGISIKEKHEVVKVDVGMPKAGGTPAASASPTAPPKQPQPASPKPAPPVPPKPTVSAPPLPSAPAPTAPKSVPPQMTPRVPVHPIFPPAPSVPSQAKPAPMPPVAPPPPSQPQA